MAKYYCLVTDFSDVTGIDIVVVWPFTFMTPTRSVNQHPSSELFSVELNTKLGTLLLSVLYRPPGTDRDLALLQSAIGSFNPARYGKVVIVGDFNVDLLDLYHPPFACLNEWFWSLSGD